ncbi:catalase family peroxidase [Glaciecola siphonariae]|uniref:Catalase-related peroxidase n=1 Tax=Glaciecola siphonariae TaxID=521012 RepID=A0ABV9LWI9_9ALTE
MKIHQQQAPTLAKRFACKLATGVSISLALVCTSSVSLAQKAPESVSANDFIELFAKLGGQHPGMRKAHARGVCAQGVFKPAKDALQYSNASFLTQQSLPAQVRFSLGGPNPVADERTPGTRGIGIQLSLPGGDKYNITGNNSPVFTGKNPETFFGFLQTLLPDENGQANPAKTGAYIAANPSVQPALAYARSNPAPASFSRSDYFGIHTFFFENEQGEQTKFRWHLSPDAGVLGLSEEESKTLPPTFLEERLTSELAEGTVSFTLSAAIGNEQDSVIDPSQQWPEERPVITLGTLEINQAGGDACTAINFDPNVVPSGIKTSDDPVLKMRSPAYGISFGKRLSQQ